MATIVTDAAKLKRWVEAKQTNEQEMLRRLYHAFSHPVAFKKVCEVVSSGLVSMMIEALWREKPVKDALDDEKRLPVWRNVAAGDNAPLDRLRQMVINLILHPGTFKIDDLSNLIRVIGTWLENGGGFGNAPSEKKKAINQALRPGIKTVGKTQDEAKELIWGSDFRQRSPRITDPALYHQIEAHVRNAWVAPPAGGVVGMQMFRVDRNDLVRKIDLLFGLLRGATISGTTTDTVLVLEAFGAQYNLHAGYYLFPVATIAANLHHTLAEAGLALSLVGAIDSYCVGFYRTLMPKGGLPTELSGVADVLRSAEEDQRNRHFILWYDRDENTPTGCIHWDKKFQVEESRRLVEGKGLLTHVAKLPRIPSKKDVAGFIDLMAPKLLAYLPQEFQPARFRGRG